MEIPNLLLFQSKAALLSISFRLLFISVLENVQKIFTKLSQTFLVFISTRIVVNKLLKSYIAAQKKKKLQDAGNLIYRLQNHTDFGMFALFLSHTCIF